MQRISARNARFQVWQSYLTNRTKRQRAGEFLVQGVRPISVAVDNGWPVRAIITDASRPLSRWAQELLQRLPGVERIAMEPELLAELGEKDEPEVVAVMEMPADDLGRIPVGPEFLGVVFDRPTGPGNVGSIIRSADAFGAHGLIVTGHAADIYDPKAVRATTGSLFAVPAVRAPSHREVLDWVRRSAVPVVVVGTDEHGSVDVFDYDFTQPTLLLIGNETNGLSTAWKESADQLVRIPITGSASSLNAANAATAALYEISRQRSHSSKTR
ncbi:TrmH family RNA methyltransferase [Kribbella sp. NPDC055071]